MAELSKQLVDAMKQSAERKTSAFDSIGTVRRVKDGIAYVHLAGGVDETPVQLTVDAKAGDEVQVRVSGGRAWIVGNATAPPTDNTMAKQAINYSKIANDAAQRATKDALVANEAAQSASESAREAKETTDEINEYAETAGKTITQILNDGETAGTAAQQAKTAADSAMKGLGQVEDVVGTLNWITAHSKVTTDTTPQAGKSYYIKNQDNTFTLVTDVEGKNPAQEGWYELTEAVQNYIMSHLALTNTGLYVMADNSHWKVRIADDGVYIIDDTNGQNKTMAKYKDAITLGNDNGTESYQLLDYNSLQLIGRGETDPYFWVSDLRDKNDNYRATITETYYGDGSRTSFYVKLPVESGEAATDSSDSSNIGTWRTGVGQKYVEFPNPPAKGATVTIIYKTTSEKAKAYTLGKRNGNVVGAMSVAEGWNNSARGAYSHVEGYECSANGMYAHAEGLSSHANGEASHAEGGYNTFADGIYSHAEGEYSIASGYASHSEGMSEARGDYSHAQNTSTATKKNQTTLGTYNVEDTATTTTHPSGNVDHGKYALLVGNGTNSNNRSNAFAVDWRGNTEASGDITASGDIEDGQGNVLSEKLDSSGIFDLIYPIGSYYWTSDGNFLPENVFGGRWEKIDAGVTLVSAGTGYTVTQGTAKDGGSADSIVPYHRHSVSEQSTGNMSANSSHSHTVGYVNYKRASTTAATTAVSYAEATSNKTTSSESVQHTHNVPAHNTNYVGTSGNTQGANMPPYKCAYCWHRTA